ncbi:hypothetical protein GCM10018793_28020 [Streptomyces sulfonofaciens]|uniref:Uncharacterized protein n=1 Tax=Streptomyces sulfonofaciens TaxID=68272 RepID=A0A919G507_9ACTN|nr:hypothetical protein [Streptomyces sulfonofaciens]GHH78185.1 hypothetical protein GCM10018793_28020 [Streptomyces sulfonofaciens]
MTTRPDPGPARDAELRRLLSVVVDTDRGESPFGWSDPGHPPHHDETSR